MNIGEGVIGGKLCEEVIQFVFINIKYTKSSCATVTILRIVLHDSNSKNTNKSYNAQYSIPKHE